MANPRDNKAGEEPGRRKPLTTAFGQEMMRRRCVMQVRTDRRTSPNRPLRRLFETVADFLSPTLECAGCGAESKQRHCKKSGVVRPVGMDEVWSRVTISEIEHLCPFCGESIWVPETSTYYCPLG